MKQDIFVFDSVLSDPFGYRRQALASEFRSIDFGHVVFHGIATGQDFAGELIRWIAQRFPHLASTLTFFRKSPLGQSEPNMVHTDTDMGEWTGILYLNPEPPSEDGTAFLTHRASGDVRSFGKQDRQTEWNDISRWDLRQRVAAQFNRLVMFPADFFHARAIESNYGQGNEARLIQVVFGKGNLTWQ